MENQLLAAAIRSREDYDLIKSYIDLRAASYSKLFQIVMTKVHEYYARDGSAQQVVPELLLTQIAETIRNDKHVERMKDLVADALGGATSDANVRAIVLLAKQQETADKLSQALVTGSEVVDDLIDQLRSLRAMTSLDELTEDGLEVFQGIDLSQLMAQEFDPDSLIKVYPSSLNDRIDGGAKKGHHFVVFAPVETGKSCFCTNASAGFLRNNKRSLYIINEDRPEDIIIRHVSNLSGMSKRQIMAEPKKAQQLAESVGFENLIVVSAAPGTPGQIEHFVEKYSPDCIIVDQLRNLHMKADNRTNQLEKAATAVRNIAKKCNVLAISVTQAGDSASGKAVLDTGDVDHSNVGIPAQADVMVGIGMTPALEAEERRVISLPKNKLSGDHSSFPVNIVRHLSRMTSV